MKRIINTLLLLFLITQTFAQQRIVKGKITDNDNEPLLGVNVIIKNSKQGTLTDENGSFELQLSGEQTLVISHIGYKTKEVIATSNDLGKIALFEGNEVLQEVIVESERKNKFSRKESAYVAKLPLKNIENSQVYNTVTNQIIVSQTTMTLDDALKNVTGLTKLWNSTGRSNDGAAYFSSRGFAVQPQLVDGVAGITNSFINSSNIERIEVIKGPSGTLFGSAVTSFGGLINIVTKKPYKGTGGTISVNYGSFDFKRINADINVTDKSQKLSLRFNAGHQSEDSFQDAGFKESWFMAPSVSFQANNNLAFNFSYELNSTEQTNPTSLFLNRSFPVFYEDLDTLNYDPNLSLTDNSVTIKNPNQNYRGEIAWDISDNWASQTIIAGSNTKSKGFYTYLWNYADWTNLVNTPYFALYAQDVNSETKVFNVQQNFTGEFKIADINNKFLIGGDYLNKRILDNSSDWAYLHTVLPDGTLPFEAFGELPINATNLNSVLTYNTPSSDIRQNILGAYVSNVFEILPELSVMAGVRYDRFDYEGDVNTTVDDATEYVESTFSPKFGIVYQPILNKLSVFANYQNGFSYQDPQFDAITGELISFDVIQANQLEFGTKANLFNNKLEGTLSFYNITVDNMYSFATATQDQKVNSKGVELEVNASPVEGLNIHTGFAYNQSEIVNFPSLSIAEGLRYHESGPETSYNFWADYKFQNDSPLKNFGLGAGFNGASDNDTMVGYLPITGSFILPAYTIFNASIYYENDKFRVGVKANNLSDEAYYTGWSTITPEQPRTFIGTLTYKF